MVFRNNAKVLRCSAGLIYSIPENISIFSLKKRQYFIFSAFPIPTRSILAAGISGPTRKIIENNNIDTNKIINICFLFKTNNQIIIINNTYVLYMHY